MKWNQTSLGKNVRRTLQGVGGALLVTATVALNAQPADRFDGPPPGADRPGNPGGPGGFMGGPGMMREKRELLKQFDKNNDHWLNNDERKAARDFLKTDEGNGRGRRGQMRMGMRPGGEKTPAVPGEKVAIGDAKTFPGVPLFDSNTVRTIFLQFENADWEKELVDFHDTDVEVPAKMTVDGKTYDGVGIHFRGMSSYSMVGEGQKRSLNVSLDTVHKKQNIDGFRTLNLLNSHEDPSFLRSVLFYQIAREYVPAPKAGFVRVVINGENWGVYVNVEQFNKDFVQEWFGTTKGARWKVPGSPNGQGSLKYLGDDATKYKKIYEIKTKDEAKSWADLIRLCKVLNETPPADLEKALAPMLDIDGALKFLALDNALINNDGFWIRTSDYVIYEDEKGHFHMLPQDANETFSKPGGPGFGGGGFGPGMMLAPPMFSQADQNKDKKVSRAEFSKLAEQWFDKLDSEKTGRLNQEEFSSGLANVLPIPGAGGGPGPQGGGAPGVGQGGGPGGGQGQRGGRGGFGPGMMAGGLFGAVDANKDGSVTRAEMKESFNQWFTKWDAEKSGSLNEEQLRTGLTSVLPAPNFGGRGGRRPGGAAQVKINGVELDPLLAANDAEKPLLSKLLAVPALRTRYLGYVHDIADKWLDWNRLGPIAEHYHSLIAADIKADTRKLDSTEDFEKSLTTDIPGKGFGPGGGGTIALKNFANQRRAYLLRVSGPSRSK